MEYKIDASGKKLGRLASEIASILLGKKSADFQKHEIADVKVTVVNASKMDIDEKKAETKVYRHYTGFPGGLREKTLAEMVIKKGYAEVLEKAVTGMIHNTRMKKDILKNLIVTE
jgi:large subunit ribosomal protein L13